MTDFKIYNAAAWHDVKIGLYNLNLRKSIVVKVPINNIDFLNFHE